MNRTELFRRFRRRIVPILVLEIALAVLFCYAILSEVKANNKQLTFDSLKVNFATTSIVQPAQNAAKETKDIIQLQQKESFVNGGTVIFADKYLGFPYRLGGRDIRTGLDCAGFVNYVFTKGPAGKHWTSMTVGGLYREIGGKSVGTKNMKPGDIIFFGSGLSHVAIYAGNGEIVHAMDESHGICRTKLYRSNGSTYSGKTIADVRRVL